MLELEQALWQKGCLPVAGVDEAGRGPLAGAVYAAAVCFNPRTALVLHESGLRGLKDSKQLNLARREAFFERLLREDGVDYGIGCASPAEIDRYNIRVATHLAMTRAVTRLRYRPRFALVDGRDVPPLACPARAVVKGDQTSLSMAAASVLAKVLRDRAMLGLTRLDPRYGFDRHKGYGTAGHLAGLRRLGPSSWHRRSFRPVREALEGSLAGITHENG